MVRIYKLRDVDNRGDYMRARATYIRKGPETLVKYGLSKYKIPKPKPPAPPPPPKEKIEEDEEVKVIIEDGDTEAPPAQKGKSEPNPADRRNKGGKGDATKEEKKSEDTNKDAPK
jgi:hypothetical protein